MKSIIAAFTLKGQEFSEIKHKLVTIANQIGEPVVLIHGFMPKDEVEKRGFSTEVVDALKEIFPIQLNMYHNGKPLRDEMAEMAAKLSATVYVVGEIKEGVAEEVELYKSLNLNIIHKPII